MQRSKVNTTKMHQAKKRKQTNVSPKRFPAKATAEKSFKSVAAYVLGSKLENTILHEVACSNAILCSSASASCNCRCFVCSSVRRLSGMRPKISSTLTVVPTFNINTKAEPQATYLVASRIFSKNVAREIHRNQARKKTIHVQAGRRPPDSTAVPSPLSRYTILVSPQVFCGNHKPMHQPQPPTSRAAPSRAVCFPVESKNTRVPKVSEEQRVTRETRATKHRDARASP